MPLIEEAENRQVAFERYETELARITLIAAAAQMSMFKARPNMDPKLLSAVAQNLSMTFRWPPMNKNRPGPDRDAHDAFLLQNQLASRVQIIMDNEGLTEEEAMIKVEMTLQQINQEEMIVAQAQMQIQEQQMAMQAQYAPKPAPGGNSGKD